MPAVFVLLLFLFSSFFILAVWRDDKKIFLLICSAVLFFAFRYETAVYRGKIEYGGRHKFVVYQSDGSSKIVKVDGKYIKKPVYASLDGENLDSGIYEVYGKITKVKNIDKFLYLDIDADGIYRGSFDRYRRALSEKIDNITWTYPREFKGFLKAILLGNKDGIDEDMKERFSYTGTAHLIVISGLHIGMITAICIFILNFLKIPYQARYLLSALFLSFYCFSIGFSPSTMRAYIMGIIYLFSKIFYEESDLKKSLCLAFIVSNCINPTVISSVSFQLSYMALFAIAFVFPSLKLYVEKNSCLKNISDNKFIKIVLDLMLLSLSIQLSLTPIFLYHFRTLPLLSFLINVLAVPLGSLVVQASFLALLLSFLGVGQFLIPLVYFGYRLLILFIDASSKLPLLSLDFYTKISPFLFVYLYLCLLLAVFYGLRSKYIIVGSVFIGVLLINLNLSSGKAMLSFNGNEYIGNEDKILILNNALRKKDIWLLKDNRVGEVDLIISRSNVDDEVIKAFKVIRSLKLNNGETVRYRDYVFKNTKDRISIEGQIY